MLSGKMLPAHPHPLPDELLSSWLVRTAHDNGIKLQTFSDLMFGKSHQLWNRDIDRLAPAWLLEKMSTATGVELERVRETTIAGYEGCLFRASRPSGLLPWITPLHIFHRKRRGRGLQFCPECLASDPVPYFRREWRVALRTYCCRHRVFFSDSCAACGSPVAFHRLELGKPRVFTYSSITLCSACNADLSKQMAADAEFIDAETLAMFERAAAPIFLGASELLPFSLEDLEVLHHLCKLLDSRSLEGRLRIYAESELGRARQEMSSGRAAFESMPLMERHHILTLALWLIAEPHCRLRNALANRAVRYNQLLKDFDTPADWYRRVVDSLPHREQTRGKR